MFGAYYREDVLQYPEATNHANIRNFMRTGCAGIDFEGTALTAIDYGTAKILPYTF